MLGDVSALLVVATLTTLSRLPKASYCLAKTSGLLLLVSRTYATVNEPRRSSRRRSRAP